MTGRGRFYFPCLLVISLLFPGINRLFMAKKAKPEVVVDERLSRKEYLRQRKVAEQTRQIKLAVMGVAALVGVILLTALVIEFVVRPRQPIVQVGDEAITLADWQKRVRFERAQILIGVDNAVNTFFNGDIGQAQTIFGQQLSQQFAILQDTEVFGEQVLNQMIDEILIRQEAQRRGIVVTSADVDKRLGERYNYFEGGLPTPLPTGTNTPVPTPSLTPIPTTATEGITVLLTLEPTLTPTVGPTSTPFPTATPVSLQAFEEAYAEELASYREKRVDQTIFRYVTEQQLYRERLLEALAEEKADEIRREELQFSLFVLSFETEAEAVEAQAQIAAADYLTVWNTVRSERLAAPPAAQDETGGGTDDRPGSTAAATEFVWRNQDSLNLSLGITNTNTIVDSLAVGQSSDILPYTGTDGVTRYYLVQLSGREMRFLPESNIEQQKQEMLSNWMQSARLDGFSDLGGWRGRAPRQPDVDPRYFVPQPTFTPEPFTADPS